jgi:hypothetical protein
MASHTYPNGQTPSIPLRNLDYLNHLRSARRVNVSRAPRHALGPETAAVPIGRLAGEGAHGALQNLSGQEIGRHEKRQGE